MHGLLLLLLANIVFLSISNWRAFQFASMWLAATAQGRAVGSLIKNGFA